MLDFIPMTSAQYDSWSQASVAGYAEENVASGWWTREEALPNSRQEFAKLLPNGLATPENYLFSIVDDEEPGPVGVIWFAVLWEGMRRHAFVYDFQIFEAYRRKGYGIRALERLDECVREMGLNVISLHVFAHNRAARDLYGKAGYRETNVIMSRELP
ncbi:MAG: GNAT family N-acetyltransferase [Thaumarchaeota archaeon]|nr:GNAT family N-acetyltransferase [Nitrososphaerota archaeon]